MGCATSRATKTTEEPDEQPPVKSAPEKQISTGSEKRISIGSAGSGAGADGADVEKSLQSDNKSQQELVRRSGSSTRNARIRRQEVKGWDEWTPHASDGLTLLSETSAQQARGGCMVTGKNVLPSAGQHYWEVAFGDPSRAKDDSTGLRYFVGVVDRTQLSELGESDFRTGVWGLSQCDAASASVWLHEDSWDPREFQLPPQSVACGFGENVGMMVDMDARPRTLQFYKEGRKLAGARVSGFDEGVRIAACPYHVGTSATLTVLPVHALELLEEGEDVHAPASETEELVTFQYTVSKLRPDERFGVDLAHMHDRLRVVGVEETGAVQRTNERRLAEKPAGYILLRGDIILEVNGVQGDRDMLKELGASRDVVLKVCRRLQFDQFNMMPCNSLDTEMSTAAVTMSASRRTPSASTSWKEVWLRDPEPLSPSSKTSEAWNDRREVKEHPLPGLTSAQVGAGTPADPGSPGMAKRLQKRKQSACYTKAVEQRAIREKESSTRRRGLEHALVGLESTPWEKAWGACCKGPWEVQLRI